jgi:hypothetical protein
MDTQARYELGRLLLHVRYRSVTESLSEALQSASEALQVTPNVLRRYARVSGVIGPEEFAELIELRGIHGMPLTWSHLELLATLRPSRERRALASEIVDHGLSIRATVQRIREMAATSQDPTPR